MELPLEEELLSFMKELGAFLGRQQDLIGLRNHELKYCKVAPKKAKKFKKIASTSRKPSPVKEAEPVKKAKRVKRPAKKSTTAPLTSVVIRDTQGVSVSKKKAPPKADRGKGIELLLDAALLKDAQLKKVLEKSRQETHKLPASGSSEGPNFKSEVPDESKANPSDTSEKTGVKIKVSDVLKVNSSDSDNVSYGNSEGESDDVNDDDNASDDDSGNEDDGEEDDDLYKDVDVRSLGAKHEKEKKGDEEMTDADQNVSQEKSYEQVIEDAHSTRIRYATRTALQLYTKEFVKKAQEERKLYIDVVEKLVKDIIKDEVKSQLPQILPKEVSDFAAPILLDKIEKSKSYQAAPEHREFYDGLVKSYNLDKDLFSSNGNVYSLERDRKDKDKDEDPPGGSNQGLKKQKTSKDAEPPKGSKSKESKSSSFKGSKPQPKSSGKSTQAEKQVFKAADTKMQHDQKSEFGHTVDKPDGEATLKNDWFKKPNKPLNPDRSWNTTKYINFRPPQTWISNIAKAKEAPHTFDELMSTNIEFSTYVMNHLKIDNLT
nr:hypothetical protein [Tanacetum cinerariifolium]